MSKFIRDIVEKFDAVAAVLNEFHPDAACEVINENGRRKTPILSGALARKHIMQAFGRSPSGIDEYRSYIIPPNHGLVVMLAQLGGFGPTDADIDERVERFTVQHIANGGRANLFPKLALEILDDVSWAPSSAHETCWLAFAGLQNAISHNVTLATLEELHPDGPVTWGARGKKEKESFSGEVRGTSAKRFESVFREIAKRVKPILPDRAYCETTTLRADPPSLLSQDRSEYHKATAHPSGMKTQRTESSPTPLQTPQALPVPSAFDKRLPRARKDEATVRQKPKLFGCPLKTYDLELDPIDYVVNGLNFPRTTSREIEDVIVEQAAPFLGITLSAQHGEGLSFALAQLAASLSKKPNTSVFWIIGDPEKTRLLLSELPGFLSDHPFKDLSFEHDETHRIVFVIDDLSELEEFSSIREVRRFHEEWEYLADLTSNLKVSFVYGVFGNFPSILDGIEISLLLSEEDQENCYLEMTEKDPQFLLDGPNGLQRIVTENPTSRSYGNDVQAFIDYLLEFGQRTKGADQNWLSRSDDLSDWEAKLVECVAVSGLLGLSLQANIAILIAAWEGAEGVSEIEQIAQRSELLTVVDDEWSGLSLASARRAESVLRNQGKYNYENLSQKVFFLFDTAIECFSENEPGGSDSLEYARHIMQRVNKAELYPVPNKKKIARFLLDRSVSRIEEIAKDLEPTTAARWSGSLCPLFSAGRNAHVKADALDQRIANLALDLAKSSISKLNSGQEPPRIMALSLFKALRRLAGSSLTNTDVRPVLDEVSEWLTEAGLVQLLDTSDDLSTPMLEYRLNEIFLASTKLKMEFKAATGLRPTDRWFALFEEKMQTLGLHLDAGSWLERARHASESQMRSLYLEVAEACAVYKHRNQATWLSKIQDEKKRKRPYV